MDVPCVGAIVRDAAGRLLVIRRGRPPDVGLWSIPGGRVEAGESLPDAVRREVLEETGLHVDVGKVAGTVRLRAVSPDDTYVVTDFFAVVAPRPDGGAAIEPLAGDDAAAVRWATYDELEALPTTDGLTESLSDWGVWA